jgi:hypothetical protein
MPEEERLAIRRYYIEETALGNPGTGGGTSGG